MHLSLLQSGDPERLGLPSGSHFERLVNCRASHAMSLKARQLDQVAHEDSEAAQQGIRIHEALHTGNLEKLSAEECELAADLRRQELELLSKWKGDAAVRERHEERLYLRREGHLFPIFTGQPDLVFVQGNRALIIDRKLGRRQVSAPSDNWQLRAYAVLLSQAQPQLEEITVTIQSPFFKYEPAIYNREELHQSYRAIVTVLASLADPGEPVTGSWCQFCSARLICHAARQEAENATLVKVIELPLGEAASRLLEQIKRAKVLFAEIESFYRRVLERDASAIPRWALIPGDVRRSIADPVQAFERLTETLSVSDFLQCCTPSVPELEKAWAKKKGLPAAKTKAEFGRFMGSLVIEKRNAPSLKAV